MDDLVCPVIDQRMLAMSGIESLKELRARRRTIPTHLISGLAEPNVAYEAQALGVIALLSNPLDVGRLLGMIAYATL